MSALPPPVEIETITLSEARRQEPECFPFSPRRCATHFHACDCREHKVAVLAKAAMDAAMELDWLKNLRGVPQEQLNTCEQIVARIYSACEAMGVTVGAIDEVAS